MGPDTGLRAPTMCGIAGVFSVTQPVPAGWIRIATDVLRHRGPDDEGFVAIRSRDNPCVELVGPESRVPGVRLEQFEGRAAGFLGHRRLSIIDLSPAGHQPMADADESCWIVFNGEIYNYQELRDELRQHGYAFRTNTDTEVLLYAYRQWGTAFLSRLNGMWAFVIYDRRRNVLVGARDRFGVKPLYYWHDSGSFAFASEIKALVSLPFVERRINDAAAFDYLVLGRSQVGAEGFFQGIHELLPSLAFEYDVSSGRLKTWRYFDLLVNDRWESFNGREMDRHVERLRGRITEAVRLRLRSDVPVGTCLSGGVDSSTIVGMVNRLQEQEELTQVGERQRVFTACYDNPAIDESRWAQAVVEQTKTSWHRAFPRAAGLRTDLEDLVYAQDVPFGSTSIYAQYSVMRLARENGVTVLLDGQGADELFTGYQSYYPAFFLEMIRSAALRDLAREFQGLKNAPVRAVDVCRSLGRSLGIAWSPTLSRGRAVTMMRPETSYIETDFWHAHQERLETVPSKPRWSLNRMLADNMTGGMLRSLLRYEDRNSMRFSIESRTPFADDISLIGDVFSIPSVYKIHDGWSKSLLRRAAGPVLPVGIRGRTDKVGFATPEYHWIQELKAELKDYITDNLKPYVNVGRLQADWDTLVGSQPRTGITHLWKFINFAIWKQIYGVR
jgi:asparagine synthase (glutamine-hydrolysing)